MPRSYLIFSFILLFTSGCKTIQEIQREANSRPVYEHQYVPLEGMNQPLPRDSALEYCRAVTSGSALDVYEDTQRRNANIKSPSEVHCSKDAWGNVKCKEKQPFGQGMLEKYKKKENERAAATSMLYSMAAAMRKCMAKSGFVFKSVCVKNCPGYQNNQPPPSRTTQERYKSYQEQLKQLEELKFKSPSDPSRTNENKQIDNDKKSFGFLMTESDYSSLSPDLKSLVTKAKEGNLRAQYSLGLSFLNGKGARKNESLGREYLLNSAEKDYFQSQYALGTVLEKEGRYEEALMWYGRSANLGHLESQFRYGYFYWQGEEKGVKKDLKKTQHWLEKAAKSGHSRSQFLLGVLYYKKGQTLDGYIWIHISEESGLAEQYLKNTEKMKSILAKELTSSQIDRAKKAASKCITSNYSDCSY